jgi:nitrile hydratase accessory protein
MSDGHSGREPIDKGEAQTRLAELIEQSEESVADDGPTFDSPAQARAFGLVVSLWQEGVFEWEQFQQQLIDQIESDDGHLETDTEVAYYDHWIEAAVQLLEAEGHVSAGLLMERAVEFADGERDASEFVVGDREH